MMAQIGSLPRLSASYGPRCQLCGDRIGGQDEYLPQHPRSIMILDEKPDWKDQMRQKGFVEGRPSDLTTVHFSLPWMWNRIYRASERPHSPYITTNLPNEIVGSHPYEMGPRPPFWPDRRRNRFTSQPADGSTPREMRRHDPRKSPTSTPALFRGLPGPLVYLCQYRRPTIRCHWIPYARAMLDPDDPHD